MIRNPGSFNNLNTQINNILKELNELAKPGYTWTLIDTIYYQKDVNWLNKRIVISKKAIGFKSYAIYNNPPSNNAYEFTSYKNANTLKVDDLLLNNESGYYPEINLQVEYTSISNESKSEVIVCKYKTTDQSYDNIQAFFQLIPVEKKTSAN